jgi:mannitol/fructose-specific phosphotransferase system IIA component (Ntr-type)
MGFDILGMRISDLMRKEYIRLDMVAHSKRDVLHQMTQMVKGHPSLGDFPSFCRSVYERESTGSTSIGYGIAIPHARTDQVKDMMLVVGRLAEGIQFEQTDQIPVRLIFLIGAPKKMVSEYLRLIGTLARYLQSGSLRQKILTSMNAEALIQTFVERESVSP